MAAPLDQCDELFAAIHTATDGRVVRTLLEELLTDYRVLSMQLGRGSVFWRGRQVDGEPFDDANALTYPPESLAPSGRLNSKGAPVLYASTREDTVVHEIGAQPGTVVQFIGFRVKEDKSIRLAAIGEFFHVYKTGYLRTLGRDVDSAITQILNSLGSERGRRLIYIDAFLASLLADPAARDNGYLHTQVLAELALERSKADGLFYPSVQEGLGMNLAILPHAFDDATFPVRCHVARLQALRAFGVTELEVLKEAEDMDSNGRFTWRKPVAPNVARFFGMTKREKEFLDQSPTHDSNTFLWLKKLYSSDA